MFENIIWSILAVFLSKWDVFPSLGSPAGQANGIFAIFIKQDSRRKIKPLY